MDLNKRLLALSWVMPPTVLPRAIQIARTLAAMQRRGWTSRVITVPAELKPNVPQDEAFGAHYQGAYTPIFVEPREDKEPSSRYRQWRRKKHPPKDLTQANWLERGARAAVREIDRWGPDAFVTFAQPWIDHEIGLAVSKRRPGTPWITHFSDPWVDSPYNVKFPPPEGMERARANERAVIEAADAIMFVTEETRALVMSKYPAPLARKTHIVPHGYDKSLLPPAPPPASNAGRPLRMVYTGNIYPGMREPSVLFEALTRLHQERPIGDLLEIEFVGSTPVETKADIERLPFKSAVKVRGHVGQIESLAAAAEADILLLMDAPAEKSVFLPSKIVDYVMVQKPILGLTPQDGAGANVLRATGHPIAPPDDVVAVTEALRTIFARAREGAPLAQIDRDASAAYDINRTTGAFESALLEVVQARTRA